MHSARMLRSAGRIISSGRPTRGHSLYTTVCSALRSAQPFFRRSLARTRGFCSPAVHSILTGRLLCVIRCELTTMIGALTLDPLHRQNCLLLCMVHVQHNMHTCVGSLYVYGYIRSRYGRSVEAVEAEPFPRSGGALHNVGRPQHISAPAVPAAAVAS